MAKQSSTQAPAPNMKYYWWGFGGTLTVLALIGVVYLMIGGGKGDLPSSFDESELPTLPGETSSGQVAASEAPVLPDGAKEQSVSGGTGSSSGSIGDVGSALVGTWKVYSQRLFYDEGGGGTVLSASSGSATTQTLSLKDDGKWTYGDSS